MPTAVEGGDSTSLRFRFVFMPPSLFLLFLLASSNDSGGGVDAIRGALFRTGRSIPVFGIKKSLVPHWSFHPSVWYQENNAAYRLFYRHRLQFSDHQQQFTAKKRVGFCCGLETNKYKRIIRQLSQMLKHMKLITLFFLFFKTKHTMVFNDHRNIKYEFINL
jgi:hypothetical protein